VTAGTAPSSASRRLLAVDALRGVAALAVVFFHLQGALDRGPQTWMPALLSDLFHAGHYGVNVFFVLSGFVIASSVRDGAWTPAFLARFTLRRSLRLDPPYWAAIALECALILAGLRLFPSLATPVPTVAQVAAHLMYAQDLLGFGHILPIFWTLCYEFQFYLVLVGLLVMYRTIANRVGDRPARRLLATACGGLFVLSIAVHHGLLPPAPRGVALDRWHQFFIGALAWWVVSGRVSLPVLAGAGVLIASLSRRPDAAMELAIMVLTSSICMLSVRRPDLDRHCGWRPLQFLGAISYSLYLYHASLGWRALSLAQRTWGMSLPPLIGVTAWLLSLVLVVGAATAFWWIVERPSMRFARRVTLPRQTALVTNPEGVTEPSASVR
jgi:peptidoglycan/LPS O-acetylase OafA/YrhL